MLKKIHIRHYRSCDDVVLDDLGPVTALVGENAAGKSNVLRAIDWLARAATETETPSLGQSSHIEIYAIVELGGHHYAYKLAVSVRKDHPRIRLQEQFEVAEPGQPLRIEFRRDGEELDIEPSAGVNQRIRIGAGAPALSALSALFPSEIAILAKIQPFFEFLRSIRYYPLDEPTAAAEKFVDQEKLDQWVSDRQAAKPEWNESVLCRIVYMHRDEPGLLDELKRLLGPDGLDVISGIEVEPITFGFNSGSRQLYAMWFQPAGQREFFEYDDLSLGTRRIVRILVSLLFDRSSVMLLEHPEDAVHRSLLRKLVGLLRAYSQSSQVILASHSPVLINCLAPDDTRLVGMQDGRTFVRALSDKEVALAVSFVDEDGSLDDFLEAIQDEG